MPPIIGRSSASLSWKADQRNKEAAKATIALVKMDDVAKHDELIQLFSFKLADEVIRIHRSEIQPPPSMVMSGVIGQEFITGVFNHAERFLIIMDTRLGDTIRKV